jgi:hypothetical protein
VRESLHREHGEPPAHFVSLAHLNSCVIHGSPMEILLREDCPGEMATHADVWGSPRE